MHVLDSSILMCFLKKEKGYEQIDNLIKSSIQEKSSLFITQINFVEVMYWLLRKYGNNKTKELMIALKSPFLGVVNYMETDLAFYTAELKSAHQLSLGDAFGLAYTKSMDGQFWTKDKALVEVANKEKINLRLVV